MSTINPQSASSSDAESDATSTADVEKKRVSRKGHRTRARERALTLLYEAETRDTDPVELAEQRREYARKLAQLGQGGMPQVSDYALKLVTGVAEEIDTIDEVLSRYLPKRPLENQSAIDRMALRIGTWELLYDESVPQTVVIDEAVKLGFEFSDAAAPEFINGVLAQMSNDIADLRAEIAHTTESDDSDSCGHEAEVETFPAEVSASENEDGNNLLNQQR